MSTGGDSKPTLMRRLRRRLSRIKLRPAEDKVTSTTQNNGQSNPAPGGKDADGSVAYAEKLQPGLLSQKQGSAKDSDTPKSKSKRAFRKLLTAAPVQRGLRLRDITIPSVLEQQGQSKSGSPEVPGIDQKEFCSDSRNHARSDKHVRAAKPTPLFNLPVEMIWEIASFLQPHTVEGANDTWVLRLSCKRLFATVDPPSYHLAPKELRSYLAKGIMPPDWGYCSECNTFHPTGPKERYTWSHRRTGCVRYLRSSPGLEQAILGGDFYLCERCLERKIKRYCKKCRRCEMCAGAKLSLEAGMVPDSYRNYKGQDFCPHCTRESH